MLTSSDEKRSSNDDESTKPVVARTPAEIQRLKLEKLMKNPDKPVIIPEKPKERGAPVVPDFVRNVMGSSAGAGSGEFHVYRHLRRKEYARQHYMSEKARWEQLESEYHQKIEDNKRKADEETAKKRAKRLKKKKNQRRRGKQPSNKGKSPSPSPSESEEDDDNSEKAEDSNKPNAPRSEDSEKLEDSVAQNAIISEDVTEKEEYIEDKVPTLEDSEKINTEGSEKDSKDEENVEKEENVDSGSKKTSETDLSEKQNVS